MNYFSRLRSSTCAFLLFCALPQVNTKGAEDTDAAPGISPVEALQRLKTGNQRFVASKLQHPHQSAERRTELATSQHPFAIVLGCADSRTAPEVVFDQGLGDIFVIRVAGNVLNDETLGSIEYGVEHLGAQLIVVLGHERCGAVKAARELIAAKAEAPGHIQSLIKAIQPAVETTAGAFIGVTPFIGTPPRRIVTGAASRCNEPPDFVAWELVRRRFSLPRQFLAENTPATSVA